MSISAEHILAAALALALAGCGEAERQAPAGPERTARPPVEVAPQPAPEPAKQAAEPSPQAGDGAADVLKRYYALIGERRYEEARALRETGSRAPTGDQFAANFDKYAEHRATIGTPSLVAEAGDWLYVEVPVQTYGKLKTGAAFGSAGTVTLRRRKSGGQWRIHTSG